MLQVFRTPLALTYVQKTKLSDALRDLRVDALTDPDYRRYASGSVAVEKALLHIVDRLLYLLDRSGYDLQSSELPMTATSVTVDSWSGLLASRALSVITKHVTEDAALRAFLIAHIEPPTAS
jgi:hypothetical protein